MSDSIRPTGMGGLGSRPNSVNLDGGPPSQQHRGLGGIQQPNQMNPGTNLMPGSTIKNVLANGMATAGQNNASGFNWKNHGGGLEQNDVLGGMLEGSGVVNQDSLDYFIGKVEDPMIKFMYYMARRETPVFYKNYQQVKERFIFDQQTGMECPLKKEFIADVNKLATFHQTVAMQGAVIFGYLLIEELRRSGKEQWSEQDFHNAVQLACYHVLFLEMLNWLFNTKKGVSFCHRLPKGLETQLASLDSIKEQFAKMWETFDAPFPYANLNFVNTISTPVEYARVYDPNNYGEFLGFVPQQARHEATQTQDMYGLQEMIKRNAAAYHGYTVNQPAPAQQAAKSNSFNNEVGMTWGTIRNDLQNLNRENMREFDLPRYFRSTGRDNHYWMPESDWVQVQRVYRRHPDMKQEETLMNGCFRVIIIDLQADNGWFTKVVRSENYDVTRVLTNPALLLPLLDKPENDEDLYMVVAAPLSDVADAATLEVPVEKVKELGKGIPAIVIDEPIIDTKSASIMANVNLITQRTTGRLQGTRAAVFDNLTEWDAYTCDKPEDKTRLFLDAPYLFVDAELKSSERPSFYAAATHLKRLFNENILDVNLCHFINGRLTAIVNQWLAHECGYNVVDGKGGGGKLQLENLAADIQDLHDELKTNDEQAYHVLMDGTASNYLTERLKMFHKVNPYLVAPEEMGSLDKIKDSVDLYVIRSFYMANIVGNKGPYYEEANVPQYVKRSTFPEIFRLMEIVVEEEKVEGAEEVVVEEVYRDKLVRFADSNNVWLFSYTLGDRNVATLRHVDTQKELVVLGVN